jgi:hypothetical protein
VSLTITLSKNGRPTLGDPEADRLLTDVVGNAKRLAAEVGTSAYVYVGPGGLSVHLRRPPRPFLEVEPDGRVMWRPVDVDSAERPERSDRWARR